MAKIAYFDCFSGCSGDMILGALLDSGLSPEILKSGLCQLGLDGYELSTEKVKRSTIMATRAQVVLNKDVVQPERSLRGITKLIEASGLSQGVKERSIAVFQRLGEVEAKIHGVPLEKVHFHELGAVDSIVDIVGVVFGFAALGIERFYSSPLNLGNGSVHTAHGILPVPTPATLQLLALVHAPVTGYSDTPNPQGELVTPTGAVLVTSLASFGRPGMIVESVGYGAGSKNSHSTPNVLCLWLGEEVKPMGSEDLILLETNIDNLSPEILGFLLEKLFAEGAKDVWFTPIQMKKNRPATMLSVLTLGHSELQMTEAIFRETSTLGLRVIPVHRHIMDREVIEFDSSLGRVKVKTGRFKGDALSLAPEYEDCRRIALERDIPLREVYRIVAEESRRNLMAHSSKDTLE